MSILRFVFVLVVLPYIPFGLVVVVFGCFSGGSLCRPYPPEPFYFFLRRLSSSVLVLTSGLLVLMFALQCCSVVFLVF